MRYVTSIAVLIVSTVWGASAAVGKPQRPPLQEFTGRLEFSGEFTLFPFPATSSRGKECVSGAFPLRKHRNVKRVYRGMSVIIRGHLVRYSSLTDKVGATERGWRGTPIPNYCGGEYVILADKIRLGSKKRPRRTSCTGIGDSMGEMVTVYN